jgi:pimeloyl-ACP methyl ester carboxylesterase
MDRRRIRRAALRVIGVLVLLVLTGATCQGVATALERRRFPRPGGMVDVGGHQLHIYCRGQGTPTVVLEAPAAGMSGAWGAVQPSVARLTRVCSYDRSGLGWSEDTDRPYDPSIAAQELRALLDAANERPPFVVAGQGLGAAFATLFASRYPDQVRALILIDAPVQESELPDPNVLIRYPGLLPWLARTGALRLTEGLTGPTEGVPQPFGGALSAFLNRPDHLMRSAREFSHWDDVTGRAADAPLDPHTSVTHLDIMPGRRLAFLTESAAAPVVRALLEAVANVRQTKGAETDASK